MLQVEHPAPRRGPPGGYERRSYFRVLTRLPLRHRRLEPGEYASLEGEILGAASAPAWRGDPALAAWLQRLEAKLDRLLERLEPARPAPLGTADTRDVDLSGSGLRMTTREGLSVGDDVLVELELPDAAPQSVRALARVVRLSEGPRGDAAEVALSFRVLVEADRDAIVRHTLDVQRRARRATLGPDA